MISGSHLNPKVSHEVASILRQGPSKYNQKHDFVKSTPHSLICLENNPKKLDLITGYHELNKPTHKVGTAGML
jgi:hypothetical protein